VVKGLAKVGIRADAIPRQQVAEQPRAGAGGVPHGEIRTLVATDIAARGIDVDGISHVFNFDLPNVPEPMSTVSAAPRAPAPKVCDLADRRRRGNGLSRDSRS